MLRASFHRKVSSALLTLVVGVGGCGQYPLGLGDFTEGSGGLTSTSSTGFDRRHGVHDHHDGRSSTTVLEARAKEAVGWAAVRRRPARARVEVAEQAVLRVPSGIEDWTKWVMIVHGSHAAIRRGSIFVGSVGEQNSTSVAVDAQGNSLASSVP